MGAVLVSPSVTEPFWNGTAGAWRHGYTYSGHAVAAAAGLANLDLIEGEDLIGRVRELEPLLTSALENLATHPLVTEVRSGVGLLAAVQVDPAALDEDPSIPTRVVSGLRSRGVLTRPLVDGSLQVSPPFVVSEQQLKHAAEVTWEALDVALR